MQFSRSVRATDARVPSGASDVRRTPVCEDAVGTTATNRALCGREPRSVLRQALAMNPLPRSLAFLVLLFSGCVNRHQQAVIDYLLRRTESSAR